VKREPTPASDAIRLASQRKSLLLRGEVEVKRAGRVIDFDGRLEPDGSPAVTHNDASAIPENPRGAGL
jgi:hypothetical protein